MSINNYLCPQCKSALNVHENITFAVKKENGKRGLIELSPEVGNYSYKTHPSFSFKQGEKLDIFCPVCHTALVAADVHKNLAKVIMQDPQGIEYDIFFSEIVGERCTFRVRGTNIQQFGDKFNQYMNFFGSSSARYEEDI